MQARSETSPVSRTRWKRQRWHSSTWSSHTSLGPWWTCQARKNRQTKKWIQSTQLLPHARSCSQNEMSCAYSSLLGMLHACCVFLSPYLELTACQNDKQSCQVKHWPWRPGWMIPLWVVSNSQPRVHPHHHRVQTRSGRLKDCTSGQRPQCGSLSAPLSLG